MQGFCFFFSFFYIPTFLHGTLFEAEIRRTLSGSYNHRTQILFSQCQIYRDCEDKHTHISLHDTQSIIYQSQADS